ncbi:MAG: hypothetical protein ABR592_00245 [Nitriliruptorales bacterium]
MSDALGLTRQTFPMYAVNSDIGQAHSARIALGNCAPTTSVPVAAVTTGRGTIAALLRLWGATLVTNLAAGWLVAGLFVAVFPRSASPPNS